MKLERCILKILTKVLDEDGNPRACGREYAKKAIRFAWAYNPNTDYGNAETGKMNVENLNYLKQDLETKKVARRDKKVKKAKKVKKTKKAKV